jgi:hypothetical protein
MNLCICLSLAEISAVYPHASGKSCIRLILLRA